MNKLIMSDNTTENKVSQTFSNRLKLLLIASKRRNKETFNIAFVSDVLKDEYHWDMKAKDAFHHCFCALTEALQFKQFEIPYQHDTTLVMEELFNCVSKFYFKKWDHGGIYPGLQDSITFEEYYNGLINHILQQFMLTRVDWCIDQLPELVAK